MDIMVDLETRGNTPGCAILSIGAVAFHPTKNDLGDEYYAVINTKSCHELGLKDDPGTMSWWSKQSEEARKVIKESEEGGSHITNVLNDFGTWVGKFGSGKVRIWGNGSDFDNAILACAYGAAGRPLPWKFWNNRCYRTLKNLWDPRGIMLDRSGTYHNALDDAKTQARHLVKMFLASGTFEI